MTRRLIAPASALKFCHKCGRELVREVTVVGVSATTQDEPDVTLYSPFEPFKKPLLNPFCAYQSAHERNEEVR